MALGHEISAEVVEVGRNVTTVKPGDSVIVEDCTMCGVCENCVAIAEGRHVDVMEMDAASNTGVQNIRDAIIETVSYRAAQARYKIFIIDEVHMLSTSAFNALLKTLEEPGVDTFLVLATSRPEALLPTVRSRCEQRIRPGTGRVSGSPCRRFRRCWERSAAWRSSASRVRPPSSPSSV